MIGVLVAITFAIWFYLTAKKVGKNAIIWAFVGLASYYGPVLIYSLILRAIFSNTKIRVSSSESALAYGLGIGLSAVAVGALSAYYIRKKVLLKDSTTEQPGDTDQNNTASNLLTEEFRSVDHDSTITKSGTSTADLYEELFQSLDAAWIWGKENEHPPLKEYPQYEEIRKIGEKIGSVSGFEGMQRALLHVKERARPVEHQRSGSEYLGGYTSLAEKAWNGIEHWT